jgi:hypothetical protein
MGLNILYNRLNVAHALSGIEDQIEGIKGEIEEKL